MKKKKSIGQLWILKHRAKDWEKFANFIRNTRESIFFFEFIYQDHTNSNWEKFICHMSDSTIFMGKKLKQKIQPQKLKTTHAFETKKNTTPLLLAVPFPDTFLILSICLTIYTTLSLFIITIHFFLSFFFYHHMSFSQILK